MLEFRGKHLKLLHDTTSEIDIEGGLNSGKTITCLTKELRAAIKWPGIWILITRWTDDAVKTLLRPPLEQVARIEGIELHWIEKYNYYEVGETGSRIYAFGLKTVSQEPEQRYGKIRGFAGSRIYVDQAEQLPKDIAEELRARLRPDIEASHKGISYPTQLTFSPNPTNDDHWLSQQFPVKNNIDGRRYYTLSLFDNQHNLKQESIDGILRTYPVDHPKHRTVVLGERGLNVMGDAVYELLFDRKLHVAPLELNDDFATIEAFEFGKHNPTWILAQRSFSGALQIYGGIMGKRLMLEDFLPVVRRYREDWLGRNSRIKVKTCCSSAGTNAVDNRRYSLVRLFRDAGFNPYFQDGANAHDTQLAMIESISSALRRRTTAKEEALQINADKSKWLVAFPDRTEHRPFMSYAFEGGYTWSPHTVSVANKQLRQPLADDEYANAMRCVENLMLNFVAGQRTDEEREINHRATQSGFTYSEAPYQSPNAWMM